ncbi:MAG: hypothetical protein HFK09_00510 [Clostridia bacterium]|nr:hypothetical protein [Clostridia bacterium]
MEYAMIKSLVVGGELADVKLYGFGTLEKIDLEKELTGQSTFLVDAAIKSGESVSLYGIEFFMRELNRVSAVTFHNFLLADVADCNMHLGSEESELKVYSFQGVNIGLIVDDDIDSELIWSKLSEKADGIISIVRTFDNARRERVKKLQKLFSLPVAVCHGEHLYSFGARSPHVMDIN